MQLARQHFLVACLWALTVAIIPACGGGGGGTSTPPTNPNQVGAGWVTITGNNAGLTNSTNSVTVTLSGDAFISPTYYRCCTGSATDTGVTVSWMNATTGVSGTAIQTPTYFSLFGGVGSITGQTWQATIDLVMGNNDITITATDPAGNLGRATATVKRIPDVTPPIVSDTSPANGATAVGTNSAFSVTFNKAMDPASISTSTVLLKDNLNNPVSGNVTYANLVATFTPVASLQGSTVYTATVTTGVMNVAGTALGAAYGWSFTTGPAPDTTPPTVSSTSPTNGETCVPTETGFVASFSEPVSSQTVNPTTFLLKDSLNNPVGGTTGGSPVQATFFPNSPLSNSSSYTGTITTGLTDLAGNHLAANYTWTITTQPAGVGQWNATSTIGAPTPRVGRAVWTGTQMLIWGGFDSTYTAFGDGARYDPATDTWQPISSVGAPTPRAGHVAIWTGSKMIIWGGSGGAPAFANLNSGAIYDPATDSWTAMALSGAPSARGGASAVWTGTEMIIWGGDGGQWNEFLGDGARYNPVTNIWSPVSTAGAPVGRHGHTAIWTGSAMLVWGGNVGNVDPLVTNTGGIYTPSSDSWTAIPMANAPAARTGHVAVWTGTEMIVWGGYDSWDAFDTGARFNASSSAWQSMATTCAPLARRSPIGVWSGTELIVWGGTRNDNGYYYQTAGRYNPITDTWQPTPVLGVPSARVGHTGVWTGTEMIVWGGFGASATSLNTGGRFRPQ